MDLCNRLHKPDLEFSEMQLHAVVLRTECLIRFIIQLNAIDD